MRACLAFALAAILAMALLAAILVLGIRTRQAAGAVPPAAVAAVTHEAAPAAWIALARVAPPGGSRRAREAAPRGAGGASRRPRRRTPAAAASPRGRPARGARAVCRSGGAAPYSIAMGA